jgi:type VI secretion system protein ImpE
LREEAFALAPATAGAVNGTPFEWIADADSRLGPVIEAVMNGAYYWVPFDRLRAIRIAEPVDLRDMVWAAAELDWPNGGATVALVSTRYPGSEANADASIRLARRTDWLEPEAGVFIGLGQRILATDSNEYPLLEVREIALETAAAPGERPDQSSEIAGGTLQSDG